MFTSEFLISYVVVKVHFFLHLNLIRRWELGKVNPKQSENKILVKERN